MLIEAGALVDNIQATNTFKYWRISLVWRGLLQHQGLSAEEGINTLEQIGTSSKHSLQNRAWDLHTDVIEGSVTKYFGPAKIIQFIPNKRKAA